MPYERNLTKNERNLTKNERNLTKFRFVSLIDIISFVMQNPAFDLSLHLKRPLVFWPISANFQEWHWPLLEGLVMASQAHHRKLRMK